MIVMVESRNANTTLMDLPKDVIIEILMRLPAKSLCRFECVSKTSLNIICCPFFATLHTRSLLNSNTNSVVAVEVPQLMLLSESITCGCDHKIMAMQLQLLKSNGKYDLRKTKHALLVTKFPNSYSLCLVFCNLFLFKREWENGGPFFLLNPLRGEVLKLPSSVGKVANYIGEKIIAEWYGVGFDNLTNTSKVVRVFKKGTQIQHTMVAEVYALGTNSWREIDSVPPCDLSGNKASAYGNMHWFVYKDGDGRSTNHIISFDFKKEEFFWTPHPNTQFSRHRSLVHLLNLRGCLAVVDLSSYDCIDVWVLKNKREWVLDYKMDAYKFVEQPRRSIESCGAWEHGIFFKQENDRVYFLDLRHDSLEVVKLPTLPPGFFNPRIFSFTGSLISLKNYGNLVEGEKTGMWQNFPNFVEEPRTGTWHFD